MYALSLKSLTLKEKNNTSKKENERTVKNRFEEAV